MYALHSLSNAHNLLPVLIIFWMISTLIFRSPLSLDLITGSNLRTSQNHTHLYVVNFTSPLATFYGPQVVSDLSNIFFFSIIFVHDLSPHCLESDVILLHTSLSLWYLGYCLHLWWLTFLDNFFKQHHYYIDNISFVFFTFLSWHLKILIKPKKKRKNVIAMD